MPEPLHSPAQDPPEPVTVPAGGPWLLVRKLGVTAVVLGTAFAVLHQTGLLQHLDRAAIAQQLAPLGIWAPVAFSALFGLWVLCCLPSAVMLLASAALFGFSTGLVVNVIGPWLGACAAFFVARYVGRDAVARRLRGKLAALDQTLGTHGFASMLLLRGASVFPFGPLSYAGGVSAMRGRDFALATGLGMLPSSLAFTYMGTSLAALDPRGVSLAFAGLAALAATAFLLRGKLFRS